MDDFDIEDSGYKDENYEDNKCCRTDEEIYKLQNCL